MAIWYSYIGKVAIAENSYFSAKNKSLKNLYAFKHISKLP